MCVQLCRKLWTLKISPRQVDRVVNKAHRRSSLLTTLTTVDAPWSGGRCSCTQRAHNLLRVRRLSGSIVIRFLVQLVHTVTDMQHTARFPLPASRSSRTCWTTLSDIFYLSFYSKKLYLQIPRRNFCSKIYMSGLGNHTLTVSKSGNLHPQIYLLS